MLEEITPFKTADFGYAVNGLQFTVLKDLVVKLLETVKNGHDDFEFLLSGKQMKR